MRFCCCFVVLFSPIGVFKLNANAIWKPCMIYVTFNIFNIIVKMFDTVQNRHLIFEFAGYWYMCSTVLSLLIYLEKTFVFGENGFHIFTGKMVLEFLKRIYLKWKFYIVPRCSTITTKWKKKSTSTCSKHIFKSLNHGRTLLPSVQLQSVFPLQVPSMPNPAHTLLHIVRRTYIKLIRLWRPYPHYAIIYA